MAGGRRDEEARQARGGQKEGGAELYGLLLYVRRHLQFSVPNVSHLFFIFHYVEYKVAPTNNEQTMRR